MICSPGTDSIYKAILDRDTPEEEIASSERNFCKKCSSMLWLYDATWYAFGNWHSFYYVSNLYALRPELIHPFASAIDSPELETPKTMVKIPPLFTPGLKLIIPKVCIMLNSKPSYVRLPEGNKEVYDEYGPETLESWHKKHHKFKA